MRKKQFCAQHSAYDSACPDCLDASIDEIDLEDILEKWGDLLERLEDED